MPVYTEIRRNGHPVPIRWGWWHLNMIREATGKGLMDMDGTTVEYDFAVCDPDDKEEFFLYKGDTLHAWRSSY